MSKRGDWVFILYTDINVFVFWCAHFVLLQNQRQTWPGPIALCFCRHVQRSLQKQQQQAVHQKKWETRNERQLDQWQDFLYKQCIDWPLHLASINIFIYLYAWFCLSAAKVPSLSLRTGGGGIYMRAEYVVGKVINLPMMKIFLFALTHHHI